MTYSIRYRPGTELARRFPQPEVVQVANTFPTAGDAEDIRRRCVNASDMEVYDVNPAPEPPSLLDALSELSTPSKEASC